ncbi:SAVED domain-containing protein [Paenibacillus athensensis]|uniref:SAVED domain-containing protein n=1 Tax=Paenibacillus athensensis TaxID=1967502 RepID=UPI00107067AE|nr:SAVED domain-containing protein [Paenibacillus athensensis]
MISLILTDIQDINEVAHFEYDLLDISIQNPGINRVLYREDVLAIRKEFNNLIEQQTQQKRYKEIHLFYSGPAGLAVEIGRSINTRIWPNIYLYSYNVRHTPHHQMAFSV